jgi:hypothetical protein
VALREESQAILLEFGWTGGTAFEAFALLG